MDCTKEVVINTKEVLAEIRQAKISVKNLTKVSLVCVSKLKSHELMQAIIDSGLFPEGPHFGENYVQEFQKKRQSLRGKYTAHCIGGLQSNKVKKAVEIFDVIQTVDSLKLAKLISKEAIKINKVIDCYLQINISNDSAKRGFLPKEVVGEMIASLKSLKGIKIVGLMTISAYYENPQDVRPDYKNFYALKEKLQEQFFSYPLELSMGMSADYIIAIEEGASVVRVGSAIFGERQSKNS